MRSEVACLDEHLERHATRELHVELGAYGGMGHGGQRRAESATSQWSTGRRGVLFFSRECHISAPNRQAEKPAGGEYSDSMTPRHRDLGDITWSAVTPRRLPATLKSMSP